VVDKANLLCVENPSGHVYSQVGLKRLFNLWLLNGVVDFGVILVKYGLAKRAVNESPEHHYNWRDSYGSRKKFSIDDLAVDGDSFDWQRQHRVSGEPTSNLVYPTLFYVHALSSGISSENI